MSDYTQTDIGAGYNSASSINTENTKVETAVNSKMDKAGTTMTGDLDMNSNDILNAATVDVNSLTIAGINVVPEELVETGLPPQAGNAGRHLVTNGTAASWDIIASNVIKSFATVDLMAAATDLSIGDVISTIEYDTGDNGGGTYDTVAISSITPNAIDVIASTGDLNIGFILRVGASVEIAQGGGRGSGFDNVAIFERLQARTNVIVLGSYDVAVVYTFATPPTLGSDLTTIVPKAGIFTGVTIQQLQGIQYDVGSITAGGLPYIDEYRGSGERVEIVQGTIQQQQAASVTITRSGTTATVTKAGHAYVNGNRVVMKGATQADYNINATISNVTTNTFDYTVANSPATPATGSPTSRNPARWEFINDANHEPIGVDDSTFVTVVGSTLVIPFTKTFTKVLSFICAPDEALANAHNLVCGASVGLSTAAIKASASIHGTGNIRYDGANWVVSEGTGQALNFVVDGSTPTAIAITHDYCPGIGVNMTSYTNNGAVLPHIPGFRVVSHTQTTIQFQDAGTGLSVGSLDTKMSFTLNKMYHEGILLDGSTGSTGDSATLDLSVGNIWFYGEFVV